MWGRVNSKKTSSWLWHAINHDNGDVVAYVIGSRHHDMLWQLTDLIYSLNLRQDRTEGKEKQKEKR